MAALPSGNTPFEIEFKSKRTIHDQINGLDQAGETLEDIYNNVAAALEPKYLVERKGSAVRLKDNSPQSRGIDFHIDVLPGRFVDGKAGDVFSYRASGELSLSDCY